MISRLIVTMAEQSPASSTTPRILKFVIRPFPGRGASFVCLDRGRINSLAFVICPERTALKYSLARCLIRSISA